MFAIPDPRNLLTYLAGGCAVIFLIASMTLFVRLKVVEADFASEKQARAEETAERERIAREATAKIAALQAEHAKQQQEASDAFERDRAALERAAFDARTDADSLRKQVDAFASPGPLDPNPDPAAAKRFQYRAATLGVLFGEADSLAGEMAAAAERHAAQVRALKRQIATDRAACTPQQ